jgi:molecular chaperone IbpA
MTTMAYGRNLLPSTIGFDRLLSTLNEFDEIIGQKKTPTYPPYNIVKFDKDNYQIQIAVAGFDKDNIEIKYENNYLTVNGTMQTDTTNVEYLHHGLASRDFSHQYRLTDTVVVKFADIVNGILKIDLENILPETKKSRKIVIGEDKPTTTIV